MNKKLKMVATAAVAVGATGSVALSLAQSGIPVPGTSERSSQGASIYSSAFDRAAADVSSFSASFSGCRINASFESKFVSVAFGVSSFSNGCVTPTP